MIIKLVPLTLAALVLAPTANADPWLCQLTQLQTDGSWLGLDTGTVDPATITRGLYRTDGSVIEPGQEVNLNFSKPSLVDASCRGFAVPGTSREVDKRITCSVEDASETVPFSTKRPISVAGEASGGTYGIRCFPRTDLNESIRGVLDQDRLVDAIAAVTDSTEDVVVLSTQDGSFEFKCDRSYGPLRRLDCSARFRPGQRTDPLTTIAYRVIGVEWPDRSYMDGPKLFVEGEFRNPADVAKISSLLPYLIPVAAEDQQSWSIGSTSVVLDAGISAYIPTVNLHCKADFCRVSTNPLLTY